MPLGPLIVFVLLTVAVAIVSTLALIPPNNLIEKLDQARKPSGPPRTK